jgi:bifunctional DNA-binding transcriptional regulator/antitoxin component of YhaV-PrlF toxin-antitoxin module
MEKDNITTVTERGQTSVPASLRRLADLKPGQRLRWEQVSRFEFRVTIAPGEEVPGPLGVLGYALKFRDGREASSDQILAELREGELD